MKYGKLYFILYWRGFMWKEGLQGIGERFADAYALPKDMVVNATLLHMVGRSEIYLENFKGILSYTCHEIWIKGFDGKYGICGSCLTIVYYSNEDMRISGQIQEVKIIRGI